MNEQNFSPPTGSQSGSIMNTGGNNLDQSTSNNTGGISLTANKTVKEEISPVNEKCLSKAMKPPITIKNFFKRSTTDQLSDKQCVVSGTDDSPSYVVGTKDQVNEESTQSSETSDLTKVGERTHNEVFGSEAKCSTSSLSNSYRPVTKSASKKRKLEDVKSLQPLKKAKQMTLFSTLQKQMVKKGENEIKSVSCPICSKIFHKGISNAELNEHIDNCIIE